MAEASVARRPVGATTVLASHSDPCGPDRPWQGEGVVGTTSRIGCTRDNGLMAVTRQPMAKCSTRELPEDWVWLSGDRRRLGTGTEAAV